jgi:O-antigen/teichoic acid export membrane protein
MSFIEKRRAEPGRARRFGRSISAMTMCGLVRRFAARINGAANLIFAARVLQNANGFLLSVLIVRRFGLGAAGTLTLATVPTVIIAVVGTLGLTYTLAQTALPIPQRNMIGFASSLVLIPLALICLAAFAAVSGHSPTEVIAIILLGMGGPFFAQSNIASALQVLQGRAGEAILPPLGNLVGLIVGASIAHSLVTFALVLALFRTVGVFIAFLRLPLARLPVGGFLAHLRGSIRFITADAMNLGSDQLSVLAASYLMDRQALGLFGLCRQLLTASDTPGWSQMQVAYPAAVSDPNETIPRLKRRMLQTGIVLSIIVSIGAVIFGLWIYHVPRLALLGPLLLASVPLRYLLGVYDMRLRALGAVPRANTVSLIRGGLALSIVPGAAWLGGDLGAILGTILLTAIAAWITGHARTQGGLLSSVVTQGDPAVESAVAQ